MLLRPWRTREASQSARCDCGETLSISVEDNGCGMSEETLRRLYEPFFTTKTKGHGTGLGMFITYGIIKRLGGRMEVRSKEGQGTTITVHLKV